MRNKEIGFIFQGFNLISNLDCSWKRRASGWYTAGVSKNERKQLAMEALKSVGLEDRMKHSRMKCPEDSSRELRWQRAVAGKTADHSCDEPTGNLDTKSTQEIHGNPERTAQVRQNGYYHHT